MADLSKLDKTAKIFLAGCMKTMMMADGNISQSELKDIDKLYTQEHFTDFEECLEEFENIVNEEKDFWKMAGTITDQAIRDEILGHIYEVSLEDGIASDSETKFYKKLEDFWK